jgi:hypothetical protein
VRVVQRTIASAIVLFFVSGAQAQSPFVEGIRGMTVGPVESSLQPGRGYGSEASEELLDYLVELGVNWISVTPFGRIWSLSSTQVLMDYEAPYEENREGIRRFVAMAHERGLKVLLIPHLWVETFGWRGEIDPGSPERWAEYRSSYRDFVLAWARDAAEAGVDAFSIGVECKSWSSRFPDFWASLIDEIRGFYPGLLTYSANWDEIDGVVFWDLLDFVGINAFYPLVGPDRDTSDEGYRKGAERWVKSVSRFSQHIDRPIVFVEVGYTTRAGAGVDPWTWPEELDGVDVDEDEQARALEIILEAFLPEESFAGFFVWRVYANLWDVSQEARWGFSPLFKRAEPVLERIYGKTYAVDPPPYSVEALMKRVYRLVPPPR